jgi:predicted RNase H-like HicB family nuclease
MQFLVTVDRDRAGRRVIACPAIPGCALRGQTDQAADDGIKRAIKSLLEIRAGRRLVVKVELLKYYITDDRSGGEVTWTSEAQRIAELIRTGAEPGAVSVPGPAKDQFGSKPALPGVAGMGWGTAGGGGLSARG